jgi:hypothetical protein
MRPRPKQARHAHMPTPKDAVDKQGSAVKQAPKQHSPKAKGQRSDVANTIAHRRQKGTIEPLESLAPDITGWKLSTVKDFSSSDYSILMVKLCEYLADMISYYQDKSANEAYVGTARRRSARRPGLIDYGIDPGLLSYLCLVEKILRQIRGNLQELYNDHFLESPDTDKWTIPYMEMCSAIADVEKRLLALASQLTENDKDKAEDED